MHLRRLTIALITFIFSASLFGNEAEEIRKLIPQQKGMDLLVSYGRLYQLSQEEDNLAYQLKCINDLIAEAHRQKNLVTEGNARVMKITLFYNNELDDSLIEQIPATLAFLEETKSMDNYYETWTYLVNVYNYAGNTNTGLKEVKRMFDDAMRRKSSFGMGLAYFAMGNVYANMHNPDEATDSYQKSLGLLMKINPYPIQLFEVFTNFADILEIQKRYTDIDSLTNQWQTFLANFYEGKTDSDGNDANRWAYYYLACAQAALGQDNLQQAEQMLAEVKKRVVGEESFLNRRWIFYQTNLYYKQNKYKEALSLNDLSMRMMDSSDKSEVINIRKQRAEILKHLGRFEEAANLYHEMYIINDSINTHDIKHQLTEMNTLFHVSELKREQEQAVYKFALIVGSVIVIALVILILYRYMAAQRLKVAHAKLEEAHGQLLTAYDQLEATTIAKERIESDLRIAREIQRGMVPQVFPPFPERTDIDLFASMTPAKEVGGDLYDFFLQDEKLYFCLGDVSGKGVPASLFMAVARNLFRVVSKQCLPPAQIAEQLNNALSEDNENGMFVTMFIGIVDLATGHLDFCNAGHNPPVIKEKDGKASFISMIPNAPLGMWPGLEFEGESIDDISMQPFLIYSDGLNEAENVAQEQFGNDHLLDLMQQLTYESAEQTVQMLNEAVMQHEAGAEQSDDLTILCLRIKGNKQ